MICPHCGQDEVETTVHLVFRRNEKRLLLQPITETETCCSNPECGLEVEDEATEALLLTRLPQLFPEVETDV